MTEPAAIEPDTKDWTFVLRSGCLECGFDPNRVAPADVADLLRGSASRWASALARADATARPAATVWSPTEYACHVRDVCRLMDQRLVLMLTEDDPLFPSWDVDGTAVNDRYWAQDPAAVAEQYAAAALATADHFAGVQPDQWRRPGRRGDGSVFTVATLALYLWHDIEHHLFDVRA